MGILFQNMSRNIPTLAGIASIAVIAGITAIAGIAGIAAIAGIAGIASIPVIAGIAVIAVMAQEHTSTSWYSFYSCYSWSFCKDLVLV